MKLIFGLGNPGDKYSGTRHNAGFAALDAYAKANSGAFSEKTKLKAFVAELNINGEKVLLAKPTTFYNLVGESYRAICDFYKIAAEDTLIIHDELALPFGTIRARIGGSDAGNNGIKSINQYGGEASARIRVGIATEQRQIMGDVDFVLARFSKDEMQKVDGLMPNVSSMINGFVRGEFESTTHA